MNPAKESIAKLLADGTTFYIPFIKEPMFGQRNYGVGSLGIWNTLPKMMKSILLVLLF